MSLRASLQSLCVKLGIETSCIEKAVEFHELLETRMNATSLSALRLLGSCKIVICLDMAAKSAGLCPPRNDVVRLSGLSKKHYIEASKVISVVLEVEERLTLRELAVQFGCTQVVSQAADILQRYTRDQCSDVDFGSPLFLCAALFVASRHAKVKIDSVKLRERSDAKKTTFDRLVDQLQKYIILENKAAKRAAGKKRGGLMDTIQAQIEDDERQAKILRNSSEEEDNTCSDGKVDKSTYEEWKRKILEKASKANVN